MAQIRGQSPIASQNYIPTPITSKGNVLRLQSTLTMEKTKRESIPDCGKRTVEQLMQMEIGRGMTGKENVLNLRGSTSAIVPVGQKSRRRRAMIQRSDCCYVITLGLNGMNLQELLAKDGDCKYAILEKLYCKRD